ncbi:hypothetical protein, partial [Bacillus sp. UNC437CL72CviS29]|uniref:hypothetical protein n=1 Tax=Bacillus sp. UNC437CL72CviS29 TaxID=1340430 RepID=UPI00068AE2BF
MSKAGVAKTQEFRKPRKRKKVVLEERVIDGEVVVGKECTKCGEWKLLSSEFHKSKRGFGGVHTYCKDCRSTSRELRVRSSLTERFINGVMVVGKECTKCGCWKPLESGFHKARRSLGGRYSQCKECKFEYCKKNKERITKYQRKWCDENKERLAKYYHNYHMENRERKLEYSRNHYKENKKRKAMLGRVWRKENKERMLEIARKWRKNNPDKIVMKSLRRRAFKKSLPDDFTIEELQQVRTYFEDGCSLTGNKTFHWDHVIPLAIGHGGTTYGNMIPLRSDLNESKGISNIFDWFEANRQRFELSQAKFDRLIAWLAAAN